MIGNSKFEKLREMESFTQEMFNRIIAVQEKQHAVWNPRAAFEQRIKDLPLHALIFSNPDRDPAKFTHTIAPWYPLHEEMATLAQYIRQIGPNALVCDWPCGNGFLGSLLARLGLNVTGVRDPRYKPNQIVDFYDPACYQMRDMPGSDIDFPLDVVFSSWMPAGENLTPEILKHHPKLIVFVYTDHMDNEGRRQVGTAEAFSQLPPSYRLIAEWSLTRPKDLLHAIWPDLTPNLEEIRHTRIFAAEPYHDLAIDPIESVEPYPWEQDLSMALLAHEAMEELRAKGIPLA